MSTAERIVIAIIALLILTAVWLVIMAAQAAT